MPAIGVPVRTNSLLDYFLTSTKQSPPGRCGRPIQAVT